MEYCVMIKARVKLVTEPTSFMFLLASSVKCQTLTGDIT